MNKLLTIAVAAMVSIPLLAQETDGDANAPVKRESAQWPAFVAVSEFPASPDVIGLRFTIPFSTKQENITGIDLGLWGRAMTAEGIQVSVIRNDVKDSMAGFQVGLYNSIGRGDMIGAQAGLWNEAGCVRGVQLGLVNVTGDAEGIQVGLINRSETMYGFQVGLINVIREAELSFCPIANIGF